MPPWRPFFRSCAARPSGAPLPHLRGAEARGAGVCRGSPGADLPGDLASGSAPGTKAGTGRPLADRRAVPDACRAARPLAGPGGHAGPGEAGHGLARAWRLGAGHGRVGRHDHRPPLHRSQGLFHGPARRQGADGFGPAACPAGRNAALCPDEVQVDADRGGTDRNRCPERPLSRGGGKARAQGHRGR